MNNPQEGDFFMFTGIITHLGRISEKTNNLLTIEVSPDFLAKITKGTSVSVNGICLTVIGTGKDSFKADFIPETAKKTNIKYLQPDNLVNLELPATPITFLSGHIVQGHIDSVTKLISITKAGNSYILKFSIPAKLARYIIEKGSIAINGISLTIIEVNKKYFSVGIIPYTWDSTMLKKIKPGDFVNIEVDILAKYIERLIALSS